jgi:uncharacterized membrane protein YdjX (TVP38/TMEM64 family)
VFIPAAVPIPILPLKLFVACAGALGVRRSRFLAVILAARIPRYAGLAYLGVRFGTAAGPWIRSHLWQMTAGVVLFAVLVYLLLRRLDRPMVPEGT